MMTNKDGKEGSTKGRSANPLRDQLELRPVSTEYLDQYDELLRYVFQVTQTDLAESGYEEGEITRAKQPVLQRSDVIGWFNKDDELISEVSVYPCKVNVHGRIYEMGGMTGVGTYPEYSGMGLVTELIHVALMRMRDNQQWISYLYPYSVTYYRKKGWEIMSDMITFDIKDSQIPKMDSAPGYVERKTVEEEDVRDVYNQFAQVTHGAMTRTKNDWDEYWRWENEQERTAAVYYNAKNKARGFMFYWIENDVFHIKEMVCLDEEARKGLWIFIGAHFSMIERVKGRIYKNEPLAFWLEDSQIIEKIEPYYMARIVDVEQFLKNYPFADVGEPFHFVVSDPMAEWNNGAFSVRWDKEGEQHISREPLGMPVTLDIQTLSSLLMSYRRPSYFANVERLHTDKRTLQLLNTVIPDQQPYFSDYF